MKKKAKVIKQKREREKEERKSSKIVDAYSESDFSTSATKERSEPSSTMLGQKLFLTSGDGDLYKSLLAKHYAGFIHLPVAKLSPSNFHKQAKIAFERLRDANYYQYDVVMAGGKHLSRTFVKRTLVGEPGITYKYLGLRLFAHPWSGLGTLPMMKAIGQINKTMIDMTKKHANHGLCNYNLTLINYMEPTSHTKVGFKDEAHYGMGKVSVSWHADSSLEDNSSIAVYHCLPTQRKAQWDWRIALRSIPGKRKGKDKDFLPVSVSTADGDCYFLLGTFNQMHQHCVLAGSESNRISSTHRVAVTKQDTYQYILKRVKNALKRLNLQVEKQKVSDLDARVIIFCQKVLTEVEMEWIAQYWLQGAQHNEMRLWWQQPLDILESMWTKLEELTFRLYQICIEEPSIGSDVVEGFLEELTVRNKQRNIWDERRADKIYQRRVSPSFRPVARPLFDNTQVSKLPKDLSRAIRELKIASKRNTSAASTIRNDKHDVSNNTSKRSMTTGKSVGLKKKKQRNGNQKRK